MPSDQLPPEREVTVTIEARDLDTDERTRHTFLVPRPRDEAEQRRQLACAASELHPTAKMRSFADGAATFLDRQHLIVAAYADLRVLGRRERHDAEGSQAPLFA